MFSLFRREGHESKGSQVGKVEPCVLPVEIVAERPADEVLAESGVGAAGIAALAGVGVPFTGTDDSHSRGESLDSVSDASRDHGSGDVGSPTALAESGAPANSSGECFDSNAASVDSAASTSDGAAAQPLDSEDSERWVEDALDVSARVQSRRIRGKRLAKPEPNKPRTFTGEQRILLLDAWRRSGLPAGDFAALIGMSKHTLYSWKKSFDELGPAGLTEQPRRTRPGSRLPEVTKRTILMLKESHPEWGCQRISDMLLRGPALPASPKTVARVLHEAGYNLVQSPTRPHPPKARRFERARPNQLWQTDLFTFVLKRQNRRLYLVAFMDDHSRFLVSYGLHASASTALVMEALEAGISSYGPPEEVLTDNGPQYITWRGKSQFTRRLEQRGIRQIVARPRRPQTLGKVERFWGTLWREFLEVAVFTDLQEARVRIGLFIDYYNFQRPHRGCDGLTPADCYFGAASEVARTLKERVAANALELARHGEPRTPFYVTGQMDGQPFSVHTEGPRLILTRPGQARQQVSLTESPLPLAQASSDQAPFESVGSEDTNRLPNPVCPHGAPNEQLFDDPNPLTNEPSKDELEPSEPSEESIFGEDDCESLPGGDA